VFRPHKTVQRLVEKKENEKQECNILVTASRKEIKPYYNVIKLNYGKGAIYDTS